MKKSTRNGRRSSTAAGSGADAADIPRRVVRLVQLDVCHREKDETDRHVLLVSVATAGRDDSVEGDQLTGRSGRVPHDGDLDGEPRTVRPLFDEAVGNADSQTVDARLGSVQPLRLAQLGGSALLVGELQLES